MWARQANLALALWLFFAPLVLRYEEPAARGNDIILGLILLVLVLSLPSVPRMRRLFPLAALWLVLAPMVLGYSDNVRATVNDMAVGVATFLLSMWPARLPARRRRPA